MNTTGKMGSEAGGTFKVPSLVFMVAACWTENVESWARQQLSITVQANIGRILITILTSSTCWTVQSSDEWTGLVTRALLRILRLAVGACVWVSLGLIALGSSPSFRVCGG